MSSRWIGLLVMAVVLSAAPIPAAEVGTPETRTEARLTRARKPSYPQQALVQGMEGQVIVWLSISAEGDVLDARVHRSSGYTLLDDHTVRFAKTLEFAPARRGQTAIPTTVLLPVRYRLADE